MRICVGNITIIGSDNDLSPGRRQDQSRAPYGFSGGLQQYGFVLCCISISSEKLRPFYLGLNVLKYRL